VSLVVTFLLFPSVLMLVSKERPRVGRAWRFSGTSVLARFTEAHGLLIVGISGLVLVSSLIGIRRLEVENSFIDYFKESTEIHQGMKVIDQSLGGTTPLDVIVDFEQSHPPPAAPESDAPEDDDIFDEFDELDEASSDERYWFTSEKMDRVKSVHVYLSDLPETGKVLSLANWLCSIVKRRTSSRPC